MGKNEIVLQAHELRFLEVQCPNCDVTTTLDCASTGTEVPRSCPSCGGSDSSVLDTVVAYKKCYQAMTGSNYHFKFRIRIQ